MDDRRLAAPLVLPNLTPDTEEVSRRLWGRSSAIGSTSTSTSTADAGNRGAAGATREAGSGAFSGEVGKRKVECGILGDTASPCWIDASS